MSYPAGICSSAARSGSGRYRLRPESEPRRPGSADQNSRELKDAGAERIWYIADAFALSVDGVFNLTNIDRWFPVQIEELVRLEESGGINGLDADFLRVKALPMRVWRSWRACGKRKSASCATSMTCTRSTSAWTPALRNLLPIHYMYSTYEEECESNPSVDRDKIMVLGGGPNRIGQGIEFDYCCVHASLALREDGYETIMVNCNPETVSTDYDTSDRSFLSR